MSPKETISPDQANLFRRWYGVRTPDGMINGKLNGRHLFSDIMMGILILMAGYIIIGSKGAYDWYQKNRNLPDKFDKHCEMQTNSDKEVIDRLSRIEGILSPRRGQND